MNNKKPVNLIGRSRISAISFFIKGDADVEREACGTTTNKSLFSEGIPVANGLYDPHYGTTEINWACQTCFNSKQECPGHDGKFHTKYGLQNAAYRKEIQKWLKVTCFICKNFVIKRKLPENIPKAKRLGEFVKIVRSGNEKYRVCQHCGAEHPWITRDKTRPGIIQAEWYKKGMTKQQKTDNIKILYNHQIAEILKSIPDANVLAMGKKLDSHPKKLIVNVIKVSANPVRAEIKKMNGNRSTMNDITVQMRTIVELDSQIPKEIPKLTSAIDADLHAKLVLIDLSFFEMIQGSSGDSGVMRMASNTNKMTNSFASRLPKKTGRLRGNLMGKRTTKIGRSVITGDKAIRPDQLGVPKMMAKTQYIPETVRSWNRKKLTAYFKNGLTQYPGCQKIIKNENGKEYTIDKLPKDYVLEEGDIVYRNVVNNDDAGFNREPALTFCSIAFLKVKIVNGLSLRLNSAVCVLFNKLVLKTGRCF